MSIQLNQQQSQALLDLYQWLSKVDIFKIDDGSNLQDFSVYSSAKGMDDPILTVVDEFHNEITFFVKDFLNPETTLGENQDVKIKRGNSVVSLTGLSLVPVPLTWTKPKQDITEEHVDYIKKMMKVIEHARDVIVTPDQNTVEIWFPNTIRAKNLDDVVLSVEMYAPEEHRLTASYFLSFTDVLNAEIIDEKTLRFGEIITITGNLDTSMLLEHHTSHSEPSLSM